MDAATSGNDDHFAKGVAMGDFRQIVRMGGNVIFRRARAQDGDRESAQGKIVLSIRDIVLHDPMNPWWRIDCDLRI
jgi:hypothetical protein